LDSTLRREFQLEGIFFMTNDRYIRRPELIQLIGTTAVSIWRWEKAGLFPKRRRIGPGSVGWLESEVNAWIASRQPVTKEG
jgi:prophage regulatory protein